MFKRKGWVCVGACLAFFLAAIPCAVLGLRIVSKHENQEAGILSFDFVSHGIESRKLAPPVSRDVPLINEGKLRGIETPDSPARTTALSFVYHSMARASAFAGQARSAASNAVNKSPADKTLPRNFTLGTEKYCVGYSYGQSCKDLPAKFPKISPEMIARRKARQKERAKSFEKQLAKITAGQIQGLLILGLIMIPMLAVLFVYALLQPHTTYRIYGISLPLFLLARLLSACLLFISFLVPTIILHGLLSAAHQISFEFVEGEVSKHCLGALCCAAVMAMSAIGAPFVLHSM